MNTAAVSSSAIVEKKTWSYLRPGSCCAARVEAGAGADAIVAKVFSAGNHLMVLVMAHLLRHPGRAAVGDPTPRQSLRELKTVSSWPPLPSQGHQPSYRREVEDRLL